MDDFDGDVQLMSINMRALKKKVVVLKHPLLLTFSTRLQDSRWIKRCWIILKCFLICALLLQLTSKTVTCGCLSDYMFVVYEY